MKTRFLLIALLGLTTCDRPMLHSEGDIEAIAHDAAVDATARRFSDLNSRIETLEQRVGLLEQQRARLDRETRAAADTTNQNNRIHEERWQAYLRHTH